MDNSKLTRLDRIEGLRRGNGLTLEQLAERTGLSSSVLSTYENDERKDILQNVAAQSMRGKTQMTHGKGKRKKKS